MSQRTEALYRAPASSTCRRLSAFARGSDSRCRSRGEGRRLKGGTRLPAADQWRAVRGDRRRRWRRPGVERAGERWARRRSTVFYKDVASFLNDTRVKPQSRAMREVLTEISMAEHAAGRPLLSAVVVRTDTRRPGKGFEDGETSESARSIEPSDVLEDAARPRLEARVDVALATLP
jgi:hypothetical protein